MEKVKISTEFIKLDQFIKFVGICGSGVEAKFFILENNIKVNGITEKQRGKKLRPGDIILVDEKEFQID